MQSSFELEEWNARLDRLERRDRRNRRLAVGGWLGLLVLVVAGQAAPQNTLEGRDLVLTDDGGKRRVVITAGVQGSPVLALLDDDGNIRAGMKIEAGVPGFYLTDARGKEALRATVNEDGPEVFLYDESHILRTGFAVKNNVPGLFLRDAAQVDRLNMTVQEGGPGLFINGTNGSQRLGMALLEDRPIVLLSDEAGQARLSILVDANGDPSVNLRDYQTNAQARLAIDDAEPELVLIEKTGNRIYEAP